MSRLVLVLAALVLSFSGCSAYGDGYGHDRPGYSVRYYERHPSYYSDDRDYRWHQDRYQDRRHSHYAPSYDGRYYWHGNDRFRNDGQRARDVRERSRSWSQPKRQTGLLLKGSNRGQSLRHKGNHFHPDHFRMHKQRHYDRGARR